MSADQRSATDFSPLSFSNLGFFFFLLKKGSRLLLLFLLVEDFLGCGLPVSPECGRSRLEGFSFARPVNVGEGRLGFWHLKRGILFYFFDGFCGGAFFICNESINMAGANSFLWG